MRHQSGEDDAEGGEPEGPALGPRIDGRCEERPDLPEDHGRGEDESGVEAHRERDRERLGDAERGEMAMPWRQRASEPVEDAVVDDVRGDRPHCDRPDRHDDRGRSSSTCSTSVASSRAGAGARASVEGLVSVASVTGRLSCVTDSLNSRIPFRASGRSPALASRRRAGARSEQDYEVHRVGPADHAVTSWIEMSVTVAPATATLRRSGRSSCQSVYSPSGRLSNTAA